MRRTDVLNLLIEQHGLKSYLELGVQVKERNFDLVNCQDKTGVDITEIPGIRNCSTDEFFKTCNRQFDLIFIDASHIWQNVRQDFINSVRVLSAAGFIVLHDCNPEKEEHTIVPRETTSGHWNGDVYKFACQLDITTVAIDNGCGVVQAGRTNISPIFTPDNWEDFDKNRKIMLNLVSWEQFVKLHSPS